MFNAEIAPDTQVSNIDFLTGEIPRIYFIRRKSFQVTAPSLQIWRSNFAPMPGRKLNVRLIILMILIS